MSEHKSFGRVFVAGSAHLDVLAKVTGDGTAIDKIGKVAIEIGGTACNISINMASLGLKPLLFTAMEEASPYTGIIASHLRSQGVDVRVVNNQDMAAAVFSAHIGPDGEMLSAVSAMPVEFASFPVATIRDSMRGCDCVVLECNLSGFTLDVFAEVAHELNLPVFVSCVSEEKSLRINSIAAPLACVFMNRREAAYFGKHVIGSESYESISAHLKCPVVVSCDVDGVIVVEDGMRRHIKAMKIEDATHTLGAGDALMSSILLHYFFGGLSLEESVRKSVAFAVEIMVKSHCSAGQGKAIENALNSLDRMAMRDPMTGLSNRRSGENYLLHMHKEAEATGVLYSVLMVDIDFFKKVNDVFGHDVGDEAIKAVAGVLSHTVRGADVACRWGGEEFLCILKNADAETAVRVAERIRSTVEALEIAVVGRVTVSLGVGTWAPGIADFSALVKAADEGLYAAKQGGRNRVGGSGIF